ncbi:MAG TPA: protein kinase [Candidatus Dormibacteraeota bacterium]|nr:protein kinase [Candidatus Dormibacteraeota bacterium]
MPLSSGSKLGPYEIQSSLGAGGMGEVYRARDTRLERTVAIKILPAHLSSNAELNARFEREARAVSSLNHPHICHLYDIGTQDGTAFLVMEYLDGETLADRLRKGPLPLKQALQLGMQITEALATAHKAGILHRDLKPGNVMLTAGGAKLLDFGLAKAAPTLSGSSAAVSGMTPSTPTMTIAELSSPAKPLTRQGTVVGTFQYMAPEVLQGAEADARSDIFGLGCVFYEMFTGRRAFEAKSQLGVMTAILEKDPEPVSQILPSAPATLDYLVRTCLEKNPEERFQTAQDVKLQLKWIAEGGANAAAAPARTSRIAWFAAWIAILAAVVAGGAYFSTAWRVKPVVRSSILPPAGAAFVTMVPASGPAVISSDGTRLAFTARDGKGKVLLYVRALSSVTAQALPGTDDAMYPFWSADNRELGFFAQGKVKKVKASGGPVQTLCDATNGRGGAWNKDGVILFAPSATAPLMRVTAAGGTPEPASKLDVAHLENSHRWPRFLPDNQHFLFWGRNSLGTQEQDLYVGELGSLQAKLIMKGVTTASYASGYLLYMREQTLLAQPFDTGRMELTGEATPIAEHVALNGATAVPEFSASQNGVLVFQTGDATGSWDLLWFTRDGKPGGALAQQERYYYPALSPDDSRVAVSLFNGTQGTADLWILDLTRGTKSRLTFGPGTQISATWSRDGKTLYYSSNAKGANHIYSKPADGSGSEQAVLDTPDASEVPICVSPDGRYLVYDRRMLNDPKSNVDILALPLTGGGKPFPVVQTPFDDANPDVSPSGKWMTYQNNESGRNEIYVTPFPGGGPRWQVSTSGGVDPKWRGDGKELYFLDLSDNLMAVDVSESGTAPRLGVPHALFQAIGVQRQVGTYVVTKDGKKFLINSGSAKQGSEPLTLVTNWTAELKK